MRLVSFCMVFPFSAAASLLFLPKHLLSLAELPLAPSNNTTTLLWSLTTASFRHFRHRPPVLPSVVIFWFDSPPWNGPSRWSWRQTAGEGEGGVMGPGTESIEEAGEC
uniref:Secreted protein n=1 Tax=Chromera velia CCMP2878 TaxID=1169474 RepID=A0A0G4GUU0_9ALVE|eukprot:Cvel_5212.t1-p1 / transcript=Cvel_5212.t1 / gene=Cvel_5212 / organism=Chromera_velia_CCMP2878 / gene_product=hypothetical protein / transcript_product=hypothetical protein / location=Cvel_scaffold240:22048-22678(+) / protein_length=107 / sequence_SO=supercontig / SO=protein_coding / is_pseudo=false